MYSRTFEECHHLATQTDGSPCGETLCLVNVVETASCTTNPSGSADGTCDANFDLTQHEAEQRTYNSSASEGCPTQDLSWNVFLTQTYGCGADCFSRELRDACPMVDGSCGSGTEVFPVDLRGERLICGDTCP